jgi:hypothetical protein
VLVIVAGVIVGVGAVCVGGSLAWRWRRPRLDAARAMPPLPTKMVRAAPPLRRPVQRPAAPRPVAGQPTPAIEHHHHHIHLHGLDAEDVAASSAASRGASPAPTAEGRAPAWQEVACGAPTGRAPAPQAPRPRDTHAATSPSDKAPFPVTAHIQPPQTANPPPAPRPGHPCGSCRGRYHTNRQPPRRW